MEANKFNYFDHYEDMLGKYGTKAEVILTQIHRKQFVTMQIRQHMSLANTAELTLTFPVYVRKVTGWKKWECSTKRRGDGVVAIWGQKEYAGHDIDDKQEFNWINKEIRDFICSYAEGKVDDSNDPFNGPAIYWVVLEETDFKPRKHKNFPRITGTQVYVGKAGYGIRRRWATEGSNHCQSMFQILNGENKPLVDARLLLANLRGERRCIFAIPLKRKELNYEEASHIAGNLSAKVMNETAEAVFGRWTPLNVKYGMNERNEGWQLLDKCQKRLSALKQLLNENNWGYRYLSKANGELKWKNSFESLCRMVDGVLETSVEWTVREGTMSFRNAYVSIDVHVDHDGDKVLRISGDKQKAIESCFNEFATHREIMMKISNQIRSNDSGKI